MLNSLCISVFQRFPFNRGFETFRLDVFFETSRMGLFFYIENIHINRKNKRTITSYIISNHSGTDELVDFIASSYLFNDL